jgi:saccharopine dehydrogenase (NAD+, L-lysine-forming)
MSQIQVWIRAETRPTERRAPLVPSDVRSLVREGVDVIVECCAQRIFPDSNYEAAGARLVEGGSWVDAPDRAVVVGLKELPEAPLALRHRHVFFGHAYKDQPGADALLARFAAGGGELLDLEYLCDAHGRRLAAFGYWAGYIGAALAILQWNGCLVAPLCPMSRERLDEEIVASCTGRARPRALVLGALGRSGSGARTALAHAGIPTTGWDIEQTRELDRAALLDHDMVINAVLTTAPVEPFLTLADVVADDRRLSVLSDVTCDVGSPCNIFPLYEHPTTWDEPVRRLSGLKSPMHVIVIDNLPSLLPKESSVSFSAALRPHIPALRDRRSVWQTCSEAFRRSDATGHHEELSNV